MTVSNLGFPILPEKLRGLSSSARKDRVVASLERKVVAIELEAARRDPDARRKDMPRNRAELRRWESDRESFWRWELPKLDSLNGPNASLVRRFYAALERIEVTRRRGRSGLRDDLRVSEQRAAQLDLQVARLVGENRQLREELRRLRSQRSCRMRPC